MHKESQISVLLTAEEFSRVQAVARADDRSMSAMCRILILRQVDQEVKVKS